MFGQDKGNRILYAEEDSFLQELIGLSLQLEGFTVLHAADGREAQTVYTKEKPDLIILGLTMQVLDGFGFLNWLRQEIKSSTPALVLTSIEQPGIEDRIMAAGANAVVFKPVKMPDLVKQIKKL
ncbi:MAG: response regulator [Mariprofundaceae bacterium]